jgi:hypothetical protein
MILALAIAALVLSVLPAAMFLANLPLFRARVDGASGDGDRLTVTTEAPPSPKVSVLIPARNEEAAIGDCVDAALASTGVVVEVLVLDDDSDDRTAEIVQQLANSDPRVRLLRGGTLPQGWNGKQHACKQLADEASGELFVFIDADVRLAPAALKELAAYKAHTAVALLSAFPQQITVTWLERWLIPMMHFILLCYLPFSRMRTDRSPSLAAGCGQLFVTDRASYAAAGTHAAIKQSRHDGVKLPRAYRAAGLATDVIDGSELAHCRMYCGAAEVVRGALKNAIEGIASPRLIGVFTVLLLGCSLLPAVALVLAIGAANVPAILVAAVALILAHVPRMIAAKRLHQSWFGACCHIPATATFVALQWIALFNHLTGRRVAWRGRVEV